MFKAFDFHYKKTRMFDNVYTPGICVYGENGLAGLEGLNGSSVYFISEKNITSSNKTKYLNYIEQSINLNGNGVYNRGYSLGDLIICMESDGVYNSVYRLVNSEQGSFKFDFEYVGRISTENESVDVLDTIESFSTNIGDNEITESLVPVNRSFEMKDNNSLTYLNAKGELVQNPSTSYNDALKCLFGFTIHPEIRIKTGYLTYYTNYDFYLRIKIKNKKSILGKNNLPVSVGYNDKNMSYDSESIVEEPMSTHNHTDAVKFEKVIEIPVSKYYTFEDGTSSSDEYTSFFINDMTCDKLHPSHNNFCSSFFDPFRSKGYKTDAVINNKNMHGFYFEKKNDLYNMYGVIDSNIDNTKNTILNKELKDLTGLNALQYMYSDERNSASCDYIQYSKNKSSNPNVPCVINFRSGESAYFSSMILDQNFPDDAFSTNGEVNKKIASLADNTYDQYVAAQRSLNYNCDEYNDGDTEETRREYVSKRREYVMDFVCSKLRDFIFNQDNTFELICVNNKTGRTKIKKIEI